ncbi:MAG: HAMP domain-containing histidine kinase [Solirubrobacteraceae bacterium]|nr:HAMP domain-containing histidine kinase [Solirubrobacteraceae bacterium]
MLRRLSIRWRLALISAALTFLVLCSFSLIYGQLTADRIRSDFASDTADAASRLDRRLTLTRTEDGRFVIRPSLDLYAAPNNAAIRLFWANSTPVEGGETSGAPELGPPVEPGSREYRGYLVETRLARLQPLGSEPGSALTFAVWIEYARPLADLEATISRLRLILILGVAGGTLLALLGGLALARRSLRPVTDITAAAREISHTGDATLRVPQPPNDDEVAELARTFDEMLESLESSQKQIEAALERQREFVADASHELRTPLTSVLANLELLSGELEGDDRDAAEAALRSTRRMRRIVADLLLLARSDAGSEPVRSRVDMGKVAAEAAAEAGTLASGHELTVDAPSGIEVSGDSDELHRVVLNLVENATLHTPAGTRITVRVERDGARVRVVVEDDGPGIPADQRKRIFDRFVRQGGDSGRSTGLGLAIVRAVAEGHGGSVTLADAAPGSRFVVELPAASPAAPEPSQPVSPREGVRPQ